MANKVAILYGKLSENPLEDELDIFDQVSIIREVLKELGYDPYEKVFGLNLDKIRNELLKEKPSFVFNIVETIENRGELHYIASALLEYLKIPYTGGSSETLMLTTNKPLSKEILKTNHISTPQWFSSKFSAAFDIDKTYILKPAKEDGSLGIDEDKIIKGSDKSEITKILSNQYTEYFAEEFIDGREFNVSVLGGKKGPEVLPIAEMNFVNFPEGKPRIMGFKAKWDENSFEYINTTRSFNTLDNEPALKAEIEDICTHCFKVFNLRGYARVDLRVSKDNKPYVIELNSNPCISEGSGFLSAVKEAGYSYSQAFQRIIEDAFKK